MSWSDREAEFERRPAWTIIRWGIILFIVLLVLGWVGNVFGLLSFFPQQATRVITKTFDADNMIGNYEWFKRQYADYQAFGPKIDNQAHSLRVFEESAGPRSSWTFEDKQTWDQMNRALLGLRNQRESIKAEYNAKANMANRSIFMGGELPAQIN